MKLHAWMHIEHVSRHNTNAMVKFACKYPISRWLMIDMELITNENRLLQKVFNPQSKHYYPHSLQLHSEMTPELSLPAFTIIKDEKKKKRWMFKAAKMGVNHDDGDEQADNDQVAGDLIDQLEPSSIQPSKVASLVSSFKISFLVPCFSHYLCTQSCRA